MSLSYLALGLAAAGLSWIAVAPSGRFAVQAARRYDFLERIERRRPDLILVGSSRLYDNVDQALLEKLLGAKVGRPIETVFASDKGTWPAWWYLALRRCVAKSGGSGLPVGLMMSGTDLTTFSGQLGSYELWQISKLVQPDDDAFFKKEGQRYRQKTDLYTRLPDRRLISRYLLRGWVNVFLAWLPGRQDGVAVLNTRLDLVEAHPIDIFRNMRDSDRVEKTACLRLDRCLEKTLLPDILRAAAPVRLFVIESHQKPGTYDPAATPAYREELERYLARHGVARISLRNRKELAEPRLWIDPNHVAPEGVRLNTRLLAEEILEKRFLGTPAYSDRTKAW